MKIIIIACLLALSGCFGTAPVKKDFPAPPAELMAPAPKLKELPEEPLVLSNAAKSIVDNYVTANLISLQLTKLQSWIKQQAELYNK